MRKSTAPPQQTESAVSQKLLDDHAKIRELVAQLKPALQEICHRQDPVSLKQAQQTLKELVKLLDVHAFCEEKVVFPALAKYHPLPILEAEHDEILLRRAAIVTGIMKYSFPEDCTDALYERYLDFIELLHRHLAKEEKAIFPLLEQSLTPTEKELVMQQMNMILMEQPVPQFEHSVGNRTFSLFQFQDRKNQVLAKLQSKIVAEKPGLRIKQVKLPAGMALNRHWSESEVILMLLSGQAIWESDGNRVELYAGDGLIMDSLLPHAIEAKQDCVVVVIFLK